MLTAAASQSSSVVSRSLAMASTFSFSGISTRMVGIPIFRDDGFHLIREDEQRYANWFPAGCSIGS